jgi:hypothetical protein
VTIIGNRNDWTFVSSAGYNNFNIESDDLDIRPGSTGTRSCLVPVATLSANEYAQAVLTGQPTVVVSGATMLLWFRPEELTSLDHESLIGIRVNPTLTSGYRIGYKHLVSQNHITFGLETIFDGTVRYRAAIPTSNLLDWRNVRISTSDVNSNPSVLVEVLDGGIWRKRGYFVDRSGNILVGATGSYSFGVREGSSPGTSGTRFDDLEVYLFPLNVTTPLPYTNSFESGSWGNDYLQVSNPSVIVPSIQVDARDGSSGLASLKLNNTDVATQSGSLYLGISDGVDYETEFWIRFENTDEAVDVHLRSIEDIASGDKSSLILRLLPATDQIKVIRREFTGDTELSTFTILTTTPFNPCGPTIDPFGDPNTWYGFRFKAEDNIADVDYTVDINIKNNGWNNVFTATDTASPLVGQEGGMKIDYSIDATSSIYIDDFSFKTV